MCERKKIGKAGKGACRNNVKGTRLDPLKPTALNRNGTCQVEYINRPVQKLNPPSADLNQGNRHSANQGQDNTGKPRPRAEIDPATGAVVGIGKAVKLRGIADMAIPNRIECRSRDQILTR